MRRLGIRNKLLTATNRSYSLWERVGLHVTPVHFYWPLPDTRELDETIWDEPSEMVGVSMQEEAQLRLLREICAEYKTDYDQFPRSPSGDPTQYYVDNESFVSTDGEMLYSMVRRLQPRKIVEVGSGFSTFLMNQALEDSRDSRGSPCEYIACDPFASEQIRGGLPWLSRLIASPVQEVPLSLFESLGEDDILFIDSSHVLRIGSDVQYLYLEVLPRLAKGVMVHIHDIFMPAEYPRDWILEHHRFWTEQYLLQAFLTFNCSWEVVWAGAYMAMRHKQALSEAFASHEAATRPGSFWMRRVRDATHEGSSRT